MKKLRDLNDRERKMLRYCAKIRCTECTLPCYTQIGLPWDEWKVFYHDEWDRLRAQPLGESA